MNIANILSIALILFSVIDIVGNIPVIIDLKKKGVEVDSMKAALVSMGLMVAFLFAGEGILKLFGLDVQSFAVAGAIILFFLGRFGFLFVAHCSTSPPIMLMVSNVGIRSASILPSVMRLSPERI